MPAYLALGDAYESRGNDCEALRTASNLYLKNSLHNKALPLLESSVELSPGQADSRADLGAVYAAGGIRAGAEIQFW